MHENHVKTIAYECGVLVAPDFEDFSAYIINNPKLPWGFYDEDQSLALRCNLDETIDLMREYVANGVENTYAIISEQSDIDGDDDLYLELADGDSVSAGIEYDFFVDHTLVLWSARKVNGEIVEGFLEAAIQATKAGEENV